MAATKALELAQLANTIDVNTSGEITNIGTLSSIATTGNATFGANATFVDNGKAVFGTDSDLEIYHSGTTSYIRDVGDGDLQIFATDDVFIRGQSTNNYMARFAEQGAVTLYHANSAKFATTSTGISVTGNATFADNGKAIFGSGSDLQIYHDGTDSYVDNAGEGTLYLQAQTADKDVKIRSDDGSGGLADYIVADGSLGTVKLKYYGDNRLQTTSTGVDITGTINTDDLVVSGNLTVSGTMTSINSDNLEIEDLNITLANGAADSTAASGAGLTVDGASATLIYTHDATYPGWSVNKAFGVGVTTPEKPFHVKDDINQLAIFESTDGRASIELRDTVDSAFLITESNKFAIHPSSAIGNNGLVMNLSTGRVGIGTDDPTDTPLEVNYTYATNFDGQDSIGWNTWDGAGLLIKNSSNDSTDNYTSLGFFTGGGSGNFSARIATVTGSSGAGYMSFLLRDNSHTSHVNEKLRITSDGDVLPGLDNTQDLGSASKRWANVYTGDLHLSNEGSKNDIDGTSGNWTVQEGEDHLYIINNKSGKKYRFALEEIE